MKITTFSIISAVLTFAAVAQAAPTPAAEPPQTIPYVVVNPENKNDTHSGEAVIQPKGNHEPLASNHEPLRDPKLQPNGNHEPLASNHEPLQASSTLRCWNEKSDGRTYTITCDGTRWFVWVMCSNGRRYETGPIAGTYTARVYCQSGGAKGGAYGN